VCCAVRGDLQKALRELLSGRSRGEVNFRRVVIETSGLADPVPIAYTLLSEPVLCHHFRLSGIIATIDAVNGMAQLAAFPEAIKQASVADRLILTKVDLCDGPSVAALRRRLRALNLSAQMLASGEMRGDVHRLLTDDIYDTQGKFREAIHWTAGKVDQHRDLAHASASHEHAADVHSFALVFDRPLDWTAFGVWASMLLHRHGSDVLRLKGLLNVAGVPTPVLINGVQHMVHPPSHLEAWPDADRRSRLIFIVRGLQRAPIERSLRAFNDLINTPAALPA
jgi:G3E family GTPase